MKLNFGWLHFFYKNMPKSILEIGYREILAFVIQNSKKLNSLSHLCFLFYVIYVIEYISIIL